jgi:geranylgeranyl reductase family protein
LSHEFDVAVAGASVAGNSAARQAAEAGLSVIVFDDDLEVGTPEKCGGLVSLTSLKQLGVAPSSRIISENIRSAVLVAPGGKTLELDATRLGVVALRRRELDKAIAKEAARAGATYHMGERVLSLEEKEGSVKVATSTSHYEAKYFVDARGIVTYKGFRPEGLLQAIQYECVFPDLRRGTVEVLFDKRLSKEYFLWVIPLDPITARVGIAGKGNLLQPSLESYIERRGGKTIKKTFASIIVGGPLDKFVFGRKVLVGDAAGQTKPITAGGIFSGGVGGKMAGEALAEAITKGDRGLLDGYERSWRNQFEKDFRVQLALRELYVDLGNDDIDALFKVLARSEAAERLRDGNFDYHSINLLRLLGAKGFLDSLLVLGKRFQRLRSLLTIIERK